MSNSQLFKKEPTKDFVLRVLKKFGIQDFDDNRSFSRKDLDKLNTVETIRELIPELKEYYINCKARTYLSDLNSKNVITILRQLLKFYGYHIISREKYVKGEKFLIYSIISENKYEYKPVVINFD